MLAETTFLAAVCSNKHFTVLRTFPLPPCADPRMAKPLSAGSESEETLSASEGEGQGEGSAGVRNKKLKAVMTFRQTEEVGAQRRDLLTGAAPGVYNRMESQCLD